MSEEKKFTTDKDTRGGQLDKFSENGVYHF